MKAIQFLTWFELGFSISNRNSSHRNILILEGVLRKRYAHFLENASHLHELQLRFRDSLRKNHTTQTYDFLFLNSYDYLRSNYPKNDKGRIAKIFLGSGTCE